MTALIGMRNWVCVPAKSNLKAKRGFSEQWYLLLERPAFINTCSIKRNAYMYHYNVGLYGLAPSQEKASCILYNMPILRGWRAMVGYVDFCSTTRLFSPGPNTSSHSCNDMTYQCRWRHQRMICVASIWEECELWSYFCLLMVVEEYYCRWIWATHAL